MGFEKGARPLVSYNHLRCPPKNRQSFAVGLRHRFKGALLVSSPPSGFSSYLHYLPLFFFSIRIIFPPSLFYFPHPIPHPLPYLFPYALLCYSHFSVFSSVFVVMTMVDRVAGYTNNVQRLFLVGVFLWDFFVPDELHR